MQDAGLEGARLINTRITKTTRFVDAQTDGATDMKVDAEHNETKGAQRATRALRLFARKHCGLTLPEDAYTEHAKLWQQAHIRERKEALRLALNPPFI